MSASDVTCWTVIRGAAAGRESDRALFAKRYASVIGAYLGARWRGHRTLLGELDDAVQEVFLDCFKEGGALTRADPDRAAGFRAYLRGVVRNVALRAETKRARNREHQVSIDAEAIEADEEALSHAFDRAWAQAVMREAAERQARDAREAGPEAERRVELVRLRFHEAMPIREIALLWKADAAGLHHEYAKARREFRRALLEVVAFHHPGTPEEVEREATELLALLKS